MKCLKYQSEEFFIIAWGDFAESCDIDFSSEVSAISFSVLVEGDCFEFYQQLVSWVGITIP